MTNYEIILSSDKTELIVPLTQKFLILLYLTQVQYN
jgi:hypothetical protein